MGRVASQLDHWGAAALIPSAGCAAATTWRCRPALDVFRHVATAPHARRWRRRHLIYEARFADLTSLLKQFVWDRLLLPLTLSESSEGRRAHSSRVGDASVGRESRRDRLRTGRGRG